MLAYGIVLYSIVLFTQQTNVLMYNVNLNFIWSLCSSCYLKVGTMEVVKGDVTYLLCQLNTLDKNNQPHPKRTGVIRWVLNKTFMLLSLLIYSTANLMLQ